MKIKYCPVCNSYEIIKLYPKFCKAKNVLCKKCGLVYINKDRDNFVNYYSADGYYKKSKNLSVRKPLVNANSLVINAIKHLKNIDSISSVNWIGKDILDVGCGYGENIYAINTLGGRGEGLEPSKESSILGEKMFSVKIYNSSLESFKNNKKYDIILCIHVLEHSPNPLKFISKLKSLLKEEGLIYIEIPNIFYPSGGYDLNRFLYNEHLQTFSISNITYLLKKGKINVIKYSCKGFIKIWCSANDSDIKNDIEKKSYNEILKFLIRYKEKYSIKNYLEVLTNKLIYFFSLMYIKITYGNSINNELVAKRMKDIN